MVTHGELFAGIGGFSVGLERAGIQTLWRVEIDADCQAVLRRHYPDGLLFSDVREVGAHNLPPVDVITFGSPCQDLSVAGRRAGLGGERSGLFFEAIRIIRELRPTFAVWENVPGALSSNGRRDFGAALDALAESGAMDIAWGVLDAQWFGVAQRRRRVFVVADFAGERAAEVLLAPESFVPLVRQEQPGRNPKPMLVGWDGGLTLERLRQCVVIEGECRKLTPLEQERLQGFPDGWTAGQGDSARYRQLGNAVCCNVAEWLGRQIMSQSGAAR